MNSKQRQGFTLVEMLLASMASALVVLAISVSLTTGFRLWRSTFEIVQLQRDGDYAMQVMARSIRDASSGLVLSEGQEIQLQRSGGLTNYQLVGDDLTCTEPNKASWTVVGDVNSVNFAKIADEIQITLELKRDGICTHTVTSVWMRNAGG